VNSEHSEDVADGEIVYNHVLKLNLQSRQWSLVDNYGDIPGVRMGTVIGFLGEDE
jgi:hypothetical protein